MNKRKYSMTTASTNILLTKTSRQKISEHNADIDAVKRSIDLVVNNCILKRSNQDDFTKHLTIALDHVNNANSTLLIARAKTLGAQAKFPAAVDDALKAIELQPKSVQGYLVAANLYSMQGRQQLASRTLTKGYRTVPESERAALVNSYRHIKRLLDRKIDFVAELPPEITAAIFLHLIDDIPTMVNCADVSRRWHNCMVQQCLGRFPKILVSDHNKHDSESRLLPLVCDEVQELLVDCMDQHNIEYLATMASHGMLSSVRTLTTKFGNSTDGSIRAHHLLLITNLGSNLTTLDIKITGVEHQIPFPLDRVLWECVNLKRLSLVSTHPVHYQPPKPSNFNGYKLTQLQTFTMNEEELLDALVRLCPRLQLLCMNDNFTNVLRLVNRYCRYLNHLFIAVASSSHNTTMDTELPFRKGLRYVSYLGTYCSKLLWLLPLLKKSKKTLETMDISVYGEEYSVEPALMEGFASLGFSELKNLRVRLIRENGLFTQALPSMLLQCPTLENVKFSFHHTSVPDNFFASLTVQPFLRNLEIKYLHSTAAGFNYLLEHLASSDTPSLLQCVTIIDSTGLTDSIMSALGNISTTTDISLKSCTGTISAGGMGAFIRKLTTNEQLRNLTLVEVPFITDDLLLHLAELSQLTTLTLASLPLITSQAVRTLMGILRRRPETFKKLSISDCESVDDGTLAYINTVFL